MEYKEKSDEAIAGVIGCDYEVSRLHEVQIVNGTNYIFSAYRTPAYPGTKAKLVQVTVHESLDGEISVLEIRDFCAEYALYHSVRRRLNGFLIN